MASALARQSSAAPRAAPRLCLITDPGPDPDDIKALLVAGVLHSHGRLELCAVVANGGGQPAMRARLARCVLEHVGAPHVPVGIGTAGTPHAAQPHEYELAGFDRVDTRGLAQGKALLLHVLHASKRRSLTIVCISSLLDFAQLIDEVPRLVLDKVLEVVIQGGVERADTPTGWRADSSVNNTFDLPAAERVYAFCFLHGLPLAIVSRDAVPLLPMQLARSFADRTSCALLRYLADAQFLGLEGLWIKLCEGKLPPRCTKQWYFETFCGVSAAEFARLGYAHLDAADRIKQHLDGFVKPYDVIALMAALPQTRDLFNRGEDPGPRMPPVRTARTTRYGGLLTHRLLLHASDAIDVRHVLQLLRDSYHDVALVARAHEAGGAPEPQRAGRQPSAAPRALARHELMAGWVGWQGALRASRPSGTSPRLSCRRKGAELEIVEQPALQPALSAAGRARRAGGVLGAPRTRVAPSPAVVAPSSRAGAQRGCSASHALGGWGTAPASSACTAAGASSATPRFRLPVAPIAAPDASGAFPASFYEQVTSSYFAKQRQLESARVDGADGAIDGAAAVAASAGAAGAAGTCATRGVLSEAAIMTLLERALSQARARGLHVTSTIAICCMALSVVLLVALFVDDAVSWTSLGVSPDGARFEVGAAALGRWHAYHALVTVLTSLALLIFVLVRQDALRARTAASVMCAECALLACTHVGSIARGAVATAKRAEGGDGGGGGGGSERVRALAAVHLGADAVAVLALSVGAVALARMAAHARRLQHPSASRTDALSRAFQRVYDVFALVQLVQAASFGAKLAAELALVGGAGAEERNVLGIVVVDTCLSLLAPGLLRWTTFRRSAQAALGRLFPSAGAYAPLSALIGYGTPQLQEPRWLVADAMQSFQPVVLDARAFRLLDFHEHAELLVRGGMLAEQDASADGASARSAMEHVEVNLDVLAALERGLLARPEPSCASAAATAADADANLGVAEPAPGPSAGARKRHAGALANLLASPAVRLHGGAGSATSGNAADLFIVHSPADHPEDKKVALRDMSRAHVCARGRAPTVWVDALCADPLMMPLERLQHLPTYIARCSKLLLLCSPALVDSLRTVLEMYAWRASGGVPEDVQCLLVAPRSLTPAQRKARWDATIAAFDTFHVMYARSELPDERERATHAIQLATVSHFNEVIRSHMAAVQRAAMADASAAAAEARGADAGRAVPPRLAAPLPPLVSKGWPRAAHGGATMPMRESPLCEDDSGSGSASSSDGGGGSS